MTIGIARIRAAYGILAIVGLAAVPGLMSAACSANAEVADTPVRTTFSPTSEAPSTRGTSTPTPAPKPVPTPTPTFVPTALVQTKPTVSLVMTSTPESEDPETVEEKWREWGVRIGEARIAGGEEILATIFGRPITVGEFEERKERLLVSIERFRHELSRDVPAHDLSPYDEARRVAVKRLLTAIEKYDIEVMVLSSFLIEHTRYDLAIGLGQLSPSDTKLATEIKKRRVAFEEHYNLWPSNGPLWALIEGYVEAVGSERYWSEILPTVLERTLAIGSWTWSVESLEKARGKAERKRAAELGAVQASSSALKGLNVLDLSSTKQEQIQAYAEERWDIFEAGLADLETLPSRPERFPYVMPLLTHGLLSPLIETLDKSTFIEETPPGPYPKEIPLEALTDLCDHSDPELVLPNRTLVHYKSYIESNRRFQLENEWNHLMEVNIDTNARRELIRDINGNKIYESRVVDGVTYIQFVDDGKSKRMVCRYCDRNTTTA